MFIWIYSRGMAFGVGLEKTISTSISATAAVATQGFKSHSHSLLYGCSPLSDRGTNSCCLIIHLPFPSPPPSRQPARHVAAISCLPHWDPQLH